MGGLVCTCQQLILGTETFSCECFSYTAIGGPGVGIKALNEHAGDFPFNSVFLKLQIPTGTYL